MFKLLIISLSFTIAYCGFGIINFYQSKHIEPTLKNLFIYNLWIIPFTFAINMLVTFTFNKGYKWTGEMFPITISYLATGVFAYIIIGYFFFGEALKLNHILACVLVLIALILCQWQTN